MNPPIVAKELEIRVVTGDAKDDPHGITARFLVTDPAGVERIAAAGKSLVTVRCARIVVTGSLLSVDGGRGSLSVVNLDLRSS